MLSCKSLFPSSLHHSLGLGSNSTSISGGASTVGGGRSTSSTQTPSPSLAALGSQPSSSLLLRRDHQHPVYPPTYFHNNLAYFNSSAIPPPFPLQFANVSERTVFEGFYNHNNWGHQRSMKAATHAQESYYSGYQDKWEDSPTFSNESRNSPSSASTSSTSSVPNFAGFEGSLLCGAGEKYNYEAGQACCYSDACLQNSPPSPCYPMKAQVDPVFSTSSPPSYPTNNQAVGVSTPVKAPMVNFEASSPTKGTEPSTLFLNGENILGMSQMAPPLPPTIIPAVVKGGTVTFPRCVPEKAHHCLWQDCGMYCHTLDSLVNHLLNVHVSTGKSSYYCDWNKCTRAKQPFTKRHKLIAHLRTHTGERPYPCTFAGCTRTFTRLDAMTAHSRIHSNYKPFSCTKPGCNRTYFHSRSLRKHAKLHETVLPPSVLDFTNREVEEECMSADDEDDDDFEQRL